VNVFAAQAARMLSTPIPWESQTANVAVKFASRAAEMPACAAAGENWPVWLTPRLFLWAEITFVTI